MTTTQLFRIQIHTDSHNKYYIGRELPVEATSDLLSSSSGVGQPVVWEVYWVFEDDQWCDFKTPKYVVSGQYPERIPLEKASSLEQLPNGLHIARTTRA